MIVRIPRNGEMRFMDKEQEICEALNNHSWVIPRKIVKKPDNCGWFMDKNYPMNYSWRICERCGMLEGVGHIPNNEEMILIRKELGLV